MQATDYCVPSRCMIQTDIFEKLVRYCTYSERCSFDVQRKMQTLKVPANERPAYLDELKEQRFLDDVRFAKMYVHTCSTVKRQGKAKIQAALRARGIQQSLIKDLLSEVADDDIESNALILAKRKLNSLKKGEPNEKRLKVLRFLISRGFSMREAQQAVKTAMTEGC